MSATIYEFPVRGRYIVGSQREEIEIGHEVCEFVIDLANGSPKP